MDVNARDFVTIAILAKDKEHTLNLYLNCIAAQTWPKAKTLLYIRTNNNTDNTASVLQSWLQTHGGQYACVYYDDTDVAEPVQQYRQHEWNALRFKVLGRIREDAMRWAHAHGSHYFSFDCDNFIDANTLQELMTLVQTGEFPIVAPMLRTSTVGAAVNKYYSNFHLFVTENGYFKENPMYYNILFRRQNVQGILQVAVVHCTYLVHHDVLPQLTYIDDTNRHEYVIFSESARKAGIPQYLDTRRSETQEYGFITFAEDANTFNTEPWLPMFTNKIMSQLELITNTT